MHCQRILKSLTGLGAGLLLFVFAPHPAAGTNLTAAFASLGFDPSAPNCATIVQISDIHMSLKAHLPRVYTNVDPRLVEMVNGMNPAPEVIVFTGDFSVMGSACFGSPPDTNACLAELWLAKQELRKFTNAPHVLMPGNHDTYGTEGEVPRLYHTIFSNTPAYGTFEVKGLRAFYLYGHSSANLGPTQEAWLRTAVGELDVNQQVAVFVHQPPLEGVVIERGIKAPLLESFTNWLAPVWTFSGHNHVRHVAAFRLAQTNIYQFVVPSANPHVSTSPDPLNPFTAGFQVICVRDAQIVGVVFGALTNATYYPVVLPAHVNRARYIFEDVPCPLLLQEEGGYERAAYAEWCKSIMSSTKGYDTGNWWAYVHHWRIRLPLGDYGGTATHALVAHTAACAQFLMGTNTNNLMPASVSAFTNQTAWIEIPPVWRNQQTLWLELTNSVPDCQMHIGGWGLATTEPADWPPRPRLAWRTLPNSGPRTLRVLAAPRRPFWIESSSDLARWTADQMFRNYSGIGEWETPDADLSRFYRVRQALP